MNLQNSYFERVAMPDNKIRIKSFITGAFVQVHPHWHSEVEILYYIRGSARQQVNEHIFTAEAGDIVIIGRDQLHSTYYYQGVDCEILVVMFDAAGLLDKFIVQDNPVPAEIMGNEVIFKNPVKSDDNNGKQLLNCILQIHEELESRQRGYQYLVRSLLNGIAGMLIRNDLFQIDSSSVKYLQSTRQVLEKTFKLISDNYSEDISLKAAASTSNLSVPHFCRLFKRATGMTFKEYLSLFRVNKAEKLLNSSSTITEIALECGFGNVSSFIRNFKKFKKSKPSIYKFMV